MIETFKIACPSCNVEINVPFMRELKAQAIEEADLAETTARDQLMDLQLWLQKAPLFALLKFWWERKGYGRTVLDVLCRRNKGA